MKLQVFISVTSSSSSFPFQSQSFFLSIFPGIVTKQTTCTQILVSGFVFNGSQTQTFKIHKLFQTSGHQVQRHFGDDLSRDYPAQAPLLRNRTPEIQRLMPSPISQIEVIGFDPLDLKFSLLNTTQHFKTEINIKIDTLQF